MPDAADDLGLLRTRVERLDAELAQVRERIRVLESAGVPAPSHERPAPLSPNKRQMELSLGLTAINRVGALTLAIGIILFFKYAVDNQWIGPRGRVFAGVAAGLLLIGAAEQRSIREQRTFWQGVAGCGIATLYVSLYAAFAWYKLISEAIAFPALIAVCALAITLSYRYVSAAITALGLLGGLLTVILLHAAAPADWSDLLYLFVLDLTCIVVALRQRWPALIPCIGAATLFVAWFLSDAGHPGRFGLFALALSLAHFTAAARYGNVPSAVVPLYLTGTGCLIVAILRALEIWTSENISPMHRGSVTSEIDSVFLALYGIFTLSYGFVRASSLNRWLGLSLLGLVILKLYLWDVWFLDHFYRTTAFVSLGVLLMAGSWIYSRSRAHPVSRDS
jgi:uncharacterized membrane protein